MTTTAPAPEQGTSPTSRTRRLAALAVVVVVGVVAAITAAVVIRGDDSANPGTVAQLSQVQASCNDWMTSSSFDSQSTDQWCTDMFAWMSEQSGGSMMGSMMWQGPDQLGSACRAWLSQDRVDMGAPSQQRCDDMVEWMSGHMSSNEGRWMMQGR